MKYEAYKSKLSYEKLVNNPDLNKYLSNIGVDKEKFEILTNSPEENAPNMMLGIQYAYQYFRNRVISGEKTSCCVVGDYDADGVTSTSIIMLTLENLFPMVDSYFYVPHRVKDGYGLSIKIIDNLLKLYPDMNTIITCDNGIAAHEAIQYAIDKGLFVILTDHHEIGETVPNANVVVHPGISPYPFASISGATVAYKMCSMFIENFLQDDELYNIHEICLYKDFYNGIAFKKDTTSQREAYEDEYSDLQEYLLQLATISIVSDVMPVGNSDVEDLRYNENRGLLKNGLESMRKKPNWRLKKIFEMCQIQYETMDETTIGFYLGPVINAVGRLDDASEAVVGFINEDQDIVIRIASWMIYLNNERKELKKEYYAKVEEILETQKEEPAVVVRCKEMHEGLIGIIAGNLKDKYQKPALVFASTTINGSDAWKASCRSVENVNIFEVLSDINENHPDLIVGFGGHAGAAGLSVLDEHFDKFNEELQKRVLNLTKHTEAIIHYQNILPSNIPAFAKALVEIKPLGNGLPKPIVRTETVINQVDFFYGSGHVKLSNSFRQEFWLYGELNNFIENPDLLKDFKMIMSNTQKKIDEGATEEEAFKAHWERWKSNEGKPFELIMEMDYGQFMGQIGPVPGMIDYKRK